MTLAPHVPPTLILLVGLAVVSCRRESGTPAGDGPMEADSTAVRVFDPAFEEILPEGAFLEELARGFTWSEGPVWRPDREDLLFSDIPANTIYRWAPGAGLSVFMRPAGHVMGDPPGEEMGTNGLLLDSEGRLVMCDHGQRAITRLRGATFTKEVLADTYRSSRFNSPNDAVYHSGGALYFTDPPYGLAELNDDPQKELAFNGVYRLAPDGTVTLLTDELSFPNGIAFSPDEESLYVSNSDPERAVWTAFPVRADGTLGEGSVLHDATAMVEEGRVGLPDGMTVDAEGRLFATGPGGVHVFTPDGTRIGLLETGRAAANATFGGDGSTLYVTADHRLLRIDLDTRGLGFDGADG